MQFVLNWEKKDNGESNVNEVLSILIFRFEENVF